MKTITLILMILGLAVCGSGQNVPATISKALANKYKKAQNVSWTANKNSFEAVFEHNNFVKKATFDKEGKWLETVTELSVDNLMSCITDLVEDEYSDSYIIEAVYFEKPEASEYIITIESNDELDDSEEETEPATKESSSSYTRLVFDDDCELVRED